ncbi:MAG: membrane protein insertase YidC [Kiloniellaceae bacterium]
MLTRYRETIEKTSGQIVLLSPPGAANPYFANFGWMAPDTSTAATPADALWQADGEILSPGRPVTLSWENGRGLRFERVYEIDEYYMFTVTQRLVNEGRTAVTLSPFGLISRTGTPEVSPFWMLHEGPVGVLNGTLEEIEYDDLQEKGLIQNETTGGWIGIKDQYWMVALVPDQGKALNTSFHHTARDGTDKYQADYSSAGIAVSPGATAEVTNHLFAGAKEVQILERYRDELGIKLFHMAIDFTIIYFLTIPMHKALLFFYGLLGNYGLAIMVVTVIIKLLFFPLANKSYRSMAKMRKLQPEMLDLRERFKDDKQRLQKEMMALYKREGANPMSGCLPIVIQIPVFIALYVVLFVTIDMRHAPFFAWIQDLSAPDPTSILNGFGLLPWTVPPLGPLDLLNLGIWPIVMGLSMFLQQRLNPQPPDPIQAKIFLFLPLMFMFILAQFPSGLVIYWTWNNLLSILQQYVIMRRVGMPVGRRAGTT